jgi:hypothetical protein
MRRDDLSDSHRTAAGTEEELNSEFLIACFLALQAAIAGQSDTGLKIWVLEGSEAENVISKTAARPLKVKVVDRDNQPVQEASVVFTAPDRGPSGDFLGSKSIIVFTNEEGLAAVQQYRANSFIGIYRIQVRVAYRGETATATIDQANIAPKKSKKILIAVAAAGVAAAAVLARGWDNPPAASNNKPEKAESIVFTGSSVGPPR